MTEKPTSAIESLINSLLLLGERIIELSSYHVITRIWESSMVPVDIENIDYSAWKCSNQIDFDIINQFNDQLANAIKTGQACSLNYNTTSDNYSIKILTCHPDKDFLLIVVNKATQPVLNPTNEVPWNEILDTAGDGTWDWDIESGKITLSPRWLTKFGYQEGEITDFKNWLSKVHPSDLPLALNTINDYLDGNINTYEAEIRFVLKSGEYIWILSRGLITQKSEEGKPLRFTGTHVDVNDKWLHQEKYQDTVRLLSKLLNSLNSGILVTDENRNIIYANQVYCDIYKLKKSPEEVIGSNLSEGIQNRKLIYKNPEYFVERTEELFHLKEQCLDEEWELVDGRVISRDYMPLSLDVNFKGEIWNLKDITEHKNVEKRFDKIRLFYECILNNISADVVVLDENYRFLFVSPYAIKDKDARAWIIGKNDEEYLTYRNKPLSLATRRKEMYQTAAKEKEAIEWIEKTDQPDGTIKHSVRRIYPVINDKGTVDMFIGYGVNITNLIRAQEELKSSMDSFENAFHYSGIGMALIGLEGNWVDVNTVLCQLLGYTKDELLGLHYIDISYPEDDEIDRDLVVKLLKHEISTYSIEKRYLTKDHKIILVSLTVSLVWNKDESPKFFIAQVVDITKRKELENELNRKNAVLEATKTSLINKINQLEELSHIIAHNLRGPANNIKLLSGSLMSNLSGEHSDADEVASNLFTNEEIATLIQEGTEALMNSLDTLMEITQIKLNKDIPYNDCNMASVIKEVMSQMHSTIFELQATIEQDLQVKIIRYPKAYLENILYNFISNSLKYCKPGIPPEIKIATKQVEDKVQISVKDNGLGIDLDLYRDRIFKLNQVFHEGYDSKGVGLYLIKTQIESLGGEVEVHSKVDVGSEFIVTL